MNSNSFKVASIGIGWWSDVLADAASRTNGQVEIVFDPLGTERWILLFEIDDLITLFFGDVPMRVLGSSAVFIEPSHGSGFPAFEPFSYGLGCGVEVTRCRLDAVLFRVPYELISPLFWIFVLPYHIIVLFRDCSPLCIFLSKIQQSE